MIRSASSAAVTVGPSTAETVGTESGTSDITTTRTTARRSSTAASLPTLNEKDFQRQVTDLAEILGYEWVHFRPAQTSRGWRTPVSGPLGKGWVDLVLVRARDGRLIFAELKAELGKTSPDQEHVLAVLRSAGCEAVVWRPSQWDEIAKELLR